MSVPPEIMQRMMAGGQPPMPQNRPPPGVGMQGAPPQSPAAAPMSTPQDKKGLVAAAHTNLHIATNMLEEALPAFGSESPEGQKIISALKILGGLMGKRDTSDLVPAEVLQMVRRLPQMGGGTDVQRQIMQQMQQKQPAPQAA
jgi:hypothetical protein